MDAIHGDTPAPTQRAGARPVSALAAGTIVAVALGTGALVAVASSPAQEVLGGNAARYVPAEGHLEWAIDDLGALSSTESARSVGYETLILLPATASTPVLGYLGEEGARTAQLWRETSTTVSGGESSQVTDLHRLSERGLELLAGFGSTLGLSYSPPLLELPADVAPGSSWSSEGSALPNDLLDYRSQYTASRPSDARLLEVAGLDPAELAECLQTDGGSEYRDSAGQLLLTFVSTSLWCPGRGNIATVGTVDGTDFSRGLPAGADGETPAFDIPSERPSRVSWGAVEQWAASEASTGYHDPFFGDQELSLSLAGHPVRTASGLIVSANLNGDDLTAGRLGPDGFLRQWYAHPGGVILGMAAVGDLVVATTSERRIVAYSGSGARLWAREVPELVLAPPVAVSSAERGLVLLAGLDGSVLLLEAATGKPVWERRLAADVDTAPVVLGGVAVVVDRAGHRTGFRLSDGEELWSEDGDPAQTAFAADGMALLVGDDGFLRAHEPATGAEQWSIRYLGAPRTALAVDGRAILATDEQVLAVDPATGGVHWSRAGAADAVSDGRSLILFELDSAVLVDKDGRELARWPVPPLSLAINRYPVAGADGILLFRSFHPVTILGAP